MHAQRRVNFFKINLYKDDIYNSSNASLTIRQSLYNKTLGSSSQLAKLQVDLSQSQSEQALQEALNNLTANKTTITIAHRLSTVKNSDVIYVMDKGQIIDFGKHNELLKSSETYKNFYDKQLRKSE